ncbi:MAG: bifunctional phosphoribosylaminoimidazolecarboxamide formyltransferase/IMP cyclohydrolase [Bacteroidia bacterium]|nr:bifunctional phosphoribosylaminoimidazolecarboxamide formyltransferase/IMP cyclohydrolase [Bacteroidia bacterium]
MVNFAGIADNSSQDRVIVKKKAAEMLRIALFASGNGSNAERIVQHFQGSDSVAVTVIFTNNPKAGVVARAKVLGISLEVLSKRCYESGSELLSELRRHQVDFIVLAGWLKHVPDAVVATYRGRIVNIHPSLLPAHGGESMYGSRVHEQVIANGDSVSGITIHHVDEHYDQGEIIHQVKLSVQPNWDATTLAQEIHALEHAHYPTVIQNLIESVQEAPNQALRKIETALISVYHKDGLDAIALQLQALGVTIISTGGTSDFLKGLGIEVTDVADLTDYPSILGGRVKTLHPKVFGGILARRADAGDVATMEEYGIPSIDLVIVDLYPFEDTVASGAAEQAIIEKIDIGGISLIRAAAKNFKDVLCLPSRNHYAEFLDTLTRQEGCFTLAQRKYYAAESFDVSSHYDSQIYGYMVGEPRSFKRSIQQKSPLRYGENPHQEAVFYGDLDAQFEQLHGKALSYNNLLDVDAAVNLMADFQQGEPCFAIFKHTNPCGVALGTTLKQAWDRALECDPVSAFGGIIICNGIVDVDVADAIQEIFFEVLIAEGFTADALARLQQKKNRILLRRKSHDLPRHTVRTAVNGLLFQEKDNLLTDSSVYEPKSTRQVTENELADVIFGEKIGKHLKSNAIAIVRQKQLIGSGVGQTSRVDALKQSIAKAGERGFSLKGAVLYSDAFFPFADSAELALKAGIEVLAEPGGSVKDQETIDFCEKHGMCLIFTKYRHFRH